MKETILFSCASFPIKLLLIILCSFVFSPAYSKTVALLGQWHLLAKQNTLDIEASKKLSQFPNQKAIYLILEEWIKNKKLDILLAEGCEDREINQDYKEVFNGWGYQDLKRVSSKKNYEDILGHVPLKLEAKYDKDILTLCADNTELIKKHQLVFSDLKGNTAYYIRLKESVDKPNIFKAYHASLNDLAGKQIKDPIGYSKQKVEELIKKESSVLFERNSHIVKLIKQRKEKMIALVIGHRHVKDLKRQLELAKIEVIVPEILQSTLPSEDLIDQFRKLMEKQ